jgi:hypothetical protein
VSHALTASTWTRRLHSARNAPLEQFYLAATRGERSPAKRAERDWRPWRKECAHPVVSSLTNLEEPMTLLHWMGKQIFVLHWMGKADFIFLHWKIFHTQHLFCVLVGLADFFFCLVKYFKLQLLFNVLDG